MTRCYLVRHAHAVWSPDPMRPLSPSGAADARRVAALLSDARIAAIYSSPHRRARQTIEPLAAELGLPIREQADLCERSLGRGDTEPLDDFEGAVRFTWLHPNFCHPNGEPNDVAQARIRALVERLARDHQGESIVLGTHGTLLTLLLHQYEPSYDYDFWTTLTMPDIYRLVVDDGDRPEITSVWQTRSEQLER